MSSLDRTAAAESPVVDESTTSEKRDDKKYWRSLDRLLESPAVQEAAALDAEAKRSFDEFPQGASESPDALNRRTMLSIMGASFALAGLQGCRRPVEKIVPYVTGPEHVIPGIPKHFATTIPFGTSAYGVVVESHEGRPTKIEGNDLHPSSLGAASTYTQAAILELYDPDRSGSVRHHSAENGDGAAEATADAGHGGDDHGAEGHGEADSSASDWATFDASLSERLSELEASGGQGLAVLSGGYSSPTLARLAAAFGERFPQADWVVYEPVSDSNIFAGCEQATGVACRPVYDLAKARKIVALDADILHSESESLKAARGFAQGRNVDQGSMNRLYAVESALSLTGAMADHRIQLLSRHVAAFADALAAELGVAGSGSGEALDEEIAAKVKLIAADLRESPGESLVIAGRRQPPAVHAMALAVNQALGAVGQAVSLHPLTDVGHGAAGELAGLVEKMQAGSVDTLVILGGNPVYDAPADLDFAGSLAKVAHSAHLSAYYDETSQACEWHLPAAGFLEGWGDARSADGSLSVVQPLIAPLLSGRSVVDLASQLAHGTARSAYDEVRETWAQLVTGEDFEKSWRKVLHDGVLEDSATSAVEVASIQAPTMTAGEAGGDLEITFHPSLTAFDGRFANNGWLQELPDALTKITWDNALLIAPATAEIHDLESGDLVSLGYRDRTLEVPVFVLPGQTAGSVALALGYGRTAAGRVGDGVGVSAYQLRDSNAPDFDSGLSLTPVKGDHELVQTQEHWSMEGRGLVREATYADYEKNGFDGKKPNPDKSHQLFPSFDYSESPQWGMAIDLNSCIGCNACVVACQSENNVPIVGKEQVSRGREMHWLRIDRYFAGEPENPEVVFQPVPCMHCENAPCEQVCPVAATVHDREGINAMVYNRCIGTRYCSNNCPYKVRRFNFFNYTKDTPELAKMAMNPDVTVRSRGVMEKCTYCLQRISEGKIVAKRAGRTVADGEIKTACQQTCPTDAIVFGDVVDENSQVAQTKKQDRDYVLLGELNNRPRTSYLAKIRNPNPHWEPRASAGDDHGEAHG